METVNISEVNLCSTKIFISLDIIYLNLELRQYRGSMHIMHLC